MVILLSAFIVVVGAVVINNLVSQIYEKSGGTRYSYYEDEQKDFVDTQVKVIDKRVESSYGATIYKLITEYEDGERSPRVVSETLYDNTNIGDTITVKRRHTEGGFTVNYERRI